MPAIHDIIGHQKQYFHTGKTLDYEFRLRRLCQLEHVIHKYKEAIAQALKKDLNKSYMESYVTEIGIVLSEISYVKKRLKLWMRTRVVPSSVLQFPGISKIYKEPYGSVLIISPWNYPFQLTMMPLVGAIAAGNCAVVKPSELSPASADIISRMLDEIFPKYYVAAVCGNADVSRRLLDESFDYIFYTGGSRVGRQVMAKAARHLTPVSLELGGKSPCIVDETADIRMAARRIMWGKCLNSGQTCVAPDYVLVHEKAKGRLLVEMKKAIEEFYGDKPLEQEQWPKMINERHFYRVSAFLKDGTIVCGGHTDPASLKIEPTVLMHVSWEAAVMQEEIFGPVLPVLTFRTIGEAIAAVRRQPRPLALYLFTENKKHEQAVLKHCHFGGGCVNDTVLHLVSHTLPFGGTGESGMGACHGKYSFDTFSRDKSILKKPSHPDVFVRYPQWWPAAERIFRQKM